MLVPHPAGLLTPVKVFLQFQAVGKFINPFKDQPSRKLHEEVTFHVSLREGEDKIDLSGAPTEQESKDKAKANREPIDNRGMGLPMIDSMFLHAPVNVDACLAFVHLAGEDASLASEGPDGWKSVLA